MLLVVVEVEVVAEEVGVVEEDRTDQEKEEENNQIIDRIRASDKPNFGGKMLILGL